MASKTRARRKQSAPEDQAETARPEPRLYLIAPPDLDPEHFASMLKTLAPQVDVACLLLSLPGADEAAWRRALRAIMPVAQGQGVAVVIADRPDIAIQVGADGVHLTAPGAGLRQITAALQPAGIVGAGGLAVRHDAMEAGELGADYVMFGGPGNEAHDPEEIRDLVAWWAEIFEVPCVGYAAALDEIEGVVAAGADFVALGAAIWAASDGPDAALRDAARRLAEGAAA